MYQAPHVAHQSAVGGTVPGYAGHRPLAVQTHGESAWGGVPHAADNVIPGQGVSLPKTTAFEEVGKSYKPHESNRTETFREAVGGIKVGYGGHVPGERNHFGSNHQGNLPRVEYGYAEPRSFPRGSPPRSPTSGEIRKMEFEPAWHLAQATGTAKQHYEVAHGSGKAAPFGLDPTNAPYVTEQSRPNGAAGPRGQHLRNSSGSSNGMQRGAALGGREGASGGVLGDFDRLQRQAAAANALPGAVAQSIYERDVHGRREVGVSPFVYDPAASRTASAGGNPLAVGNAMGDADLTAHPKNAAIGLHHSASPANRGGSRFDQFVNGAGEMDDWVDKAHKGFPPPPSVRSAQAQQARKPSHAYETEMLNPRGSYHLSQSGIEREAPRGGGDGGAATPPLTQQGEKHRSRIGSAVRGQAPPSPVPFSPNADPQPTGGSSGGNPFSSRLFSPQGSQRGTPRKPGGGAAASGGMRGAGSGVDQVRLYGNRAGSRGGTPPMTPPLTPTATGGASRAHGRPTGTRYVYSDPRGSPPQAQTQQRPQSPPPSHAQADWRNVPAMRGDYWGGGAPRASPRAWRRDEPSSALYEA